MPDILTMISDAERLDFSQNLSIARPNYLGDTLFPDQKTQHFQAEYLRLANGATLPVTATVHAFDTEAEIASRPAFDKVTVEKLLIKRKINQTERLRLLLNNGVMGEEALVQYIFDDMGRLADSVKTRTEAAKMELLSTGKMTVTENNLNLTIDYGVPAENTAYSFAWSSADADIMGDIQKVVDAAADNGHTITGILTSGNVMRYILANEAIQTAIYGTAGVGTLPSTERLKGLFGQMGFPTELLTYNLRYGVERADGTQEKKRFYPENKVTFLVSNVSGGTGVGLWGVTPEEEELGQYTEKSAQQYITLTQWATPDPVAVWTKASGLFIPVLPDPSGLYIGTVS